VDIRSYSLLMVVGPRHGARAEGRGPRVGHGGSRCRVVPPP